MTRLLAPGILVMLLAGCAALRPAPFSSDPTPPASLYTFRSGTNNGLRLEGAPWWCRTLGGLFADPAPGGDPVSDSITGTINSFRFMRGK